MQKTRFKKYIDLFINNVTPLITDSWKKRSFLIITLLSGFYFTNSLISFLLDQSINTVFLALFIILIMELSIRSILLSKNPNFSLFSLIINNFRIGSTYALLLEAFKLGS